MQANNEQGDANYRETCLINILGRITDDIKDDQNDNAGLKD